MDLYSSSILAWRFTPVSVKAIDVALLLYDIVRPKFLRNGWPEGARWNYVGLPEALVIEQLGSEEGASGESSLAGIPFLPPEVLVPDRGKVLISRAAKDACVRLGIDMQFARPYTPTDKAHIERLFRTIRDNFVMNLKGYKGPDVFSRGKDIEKEAFFFIDEIEAEFAQWVAVYWQNRTHLGLEFPDLPKMDLSPNKMYEEGVSRAGFTFVLPDPNLYFELLPTEWRKIQHYGVDVRGLRYNSEVLDEWRNVPSPYPNVHNGAWPIRYDPRDLSEIFFYDITLNEWHAIPRHGASGGKRPFNDATLSYAKSLVIARGGESAADRRRQLSEVLDRTLDRIAALEVEGRKERHVAALHAMRTLESGADRVREQRKDEVSEVAGVMAPDAEISLDDLFAPDQSVALSAHDAQSESGQNRRRTIRPVVNPEDFDV